MKLADIVVIATGGADDAPAVEFAAKLAADDGAQVRVVTALPDTTAELSGWSGLGAYVDPGVIEQLAAVEAETRTRVAELSERTAKNAGLAIGRHPGACMIVEDSRTPVWLAVLRAAPLADLVIISSETANGARGPSTPLTDALMAARSPVLVVRKAPLSTGGLAAVAWDGGLQAGRAVRAALPLLVKAERVVILQDSAGLDPVEEGAADPRLLAAYLNRRGVADVTIEEVPGGAGGGPLLIAAETRGAGLLVAGAYGHSRVREWIFGGATRALLSARSAPHLLLAH